MPMKFYFLFAFCLLSFLSAQSPSDSLAGYLVIKGSFVIVDKQPDGDSVRFRPDDESLLKKLKRGYRIDPSKDGTVQLRFEAIDAPELHYLGDAQPMGREARDFLLSQLGFNNYIHNHNDTITDAVPREIRGGILSQAAETNGRPISYVFLEGDLTDLNDGERIAIDDALLAKSMNAKVLQAGMAYYTVYSSQPASHQAFMRGLAESAKAANLGVWQVDKTAEFNLTSFRDVTTNQLILPKLYRRCIGYLRDRDKGFSGNLKDWLLADADRDDAVMLGTRQTKLSSLLEIDGAKVTVLFNPLEAVFIEK
ncbi:MAG: thermonuclease family protein [Trueperaceae bacterium]